jgi:hypothetical protein
MKINPRKPCPHPRGSDERIECYRLRLKLNLPLHHPEDSTDIIPLGDNGQSRSPKEPGIHECRRLGD